MFIFFLPLSSRKLNNYKTLVTKFTEVTSQIRSMVFCRVCNCFEHFRNKISDFRCLLSKATLREAIFLNIIDIINNDGENREKNHLLFLTLSVYILYNYSYLFIFSIGNLREIICSLWFFLIVFFSGESPIHDDKY